MNHLVTTSIFKHTGVKQLALPSVHISDFTKIFRNLHSIASFIIEIQLVCCSIYFRKTYILYTHTFLLKLYRNAIG